MPETHTQGHVKKQTLTEAEATSIEQLITTCNNYEGLRMRIDAGALHQRPERETNDFLYYEDGMLVGYLFVDCWGSRDRELAGMVHPDYRRRGIFRCLLAEAQQACRQRAIQKLILVCEHASQSGLAFVRAIQAQYEYSEHEMVLGTFRERRQAHKGLDIRQANKQDLDAIVSILATDSGNVESIKEWVAKLFDDSSSRFYIAALDENPLGCLRLDFMSDQIGIYAFEVRLGYRGLGYGRQMLEKAIRTIRSESQIRIMLDVETDNTNAIGLYLSCGFEIKTTYDYYELKIHRENEYMHWLELTVQTHPEAVESVSELLNRYTTGGVAIEEPIELIDEGQEYRVLSGQPVKVHAYVPIDGKEEAARQQVAEGLWHLSSLGPRFVGDLQTRVVHEEDWANAWKDYYHVTHIGQRLVIRPSWREYQPQNEEVVLELDPGMAFGTGLHPTTRMCLEQVGQRVRSNMRVLDVGTGSGILALAAAKLGAASVYCIDNSSVAVESALANTEMNHMSDRVNVVLGVLDEDESTRLDGQYDLVLANIIARVIGSIAPNLAQVLAPGGILITSGIIDDRRHEAEQPLLDTGLKLIDQVMIDDWVTLVMQK